MPSALVRNAALTDIPAITRIYAHSVKHGTAWFELEAPDEDEMTRRMKTLLDAAFPYLVAAIEGAIVGYAYAGPYRPRRAYRFSVEDSIYIDPAAQRKGVGRALLEKLIEECERRGFRQMIAVIGDSAQTSSIELHRALGFRLIGNIENVGYKFDRWLDSILMQRALGPGATTKP